MDVPYKFWKIFQIVRSEPRESYNGQRSFSASRRDSLSNAALFHAFQPRYDLYTSVTQRAVTILDVESASGWELRRSDSWGQCSLSLSDGTTCCVPDLEFNGGG